jgi:hypothetical protein
MNKSRRKEIGRAVELLESAREILENAAEEENSYAEEMPENLQGSERYERAMEAADILENATAEVADLVCNIEEAMQ